MLECVVNLSEGRDRALVARLAAAAAESLLDLHVDPDHNRSVLTLAGPEVQTTVRVLTQAALEAIDLRVHSGVHPRLGAVDVVPFTPLDDAGTPLSTDGDLASAIRARDDFATWAGAELALPCFTYGPERSLPEVRRRAFVDLVPDTGPPVPHPSAGACAVGARPVLVAYNLWLDTGDLTITRAIASAVRQPGLRTLGLAVGPPGQASQVSCNLLEPTRLGPARVYECVAGAARDHGASVVRAELVGLVPRAVVDEVPVPMRARLDLDVERTVEARLDGRPGLRG